jgi:hypothetical protein
MFWVGLTGTGQNRSLGTRAERGHGFEALLVLTGSTASANL